MPIDAIPDCDVRFELGDWVIRRTQMEELRRNPDWRYYAAHGCGGSWFVDDNPNVARCIACKRPVPEEIQGLLLMLLTKRTED